MFDKKCALENFNHHFYEKLALRTLNGLKLKLENNIFCSQINQKQKYYRHYKERRGWNKKFKAGH